MLGREQSMDSRGRWPNSMIYESAESVSLKSSSSLTVDYDSSSVPSIGSESPTHPSSTEFDDIEGDQVFDPSESETKPNSRKRRRKRELQANNVLFTITDHGTVTPRLIIPHVIKSDARLTYANMVAAVYNSCDFNFMIRFMKTYFRSDFTVMQELSGNFPEGMKGKYEIYGLEVNCQYWYERMLDFPDVVFTLKDVKVQINTDEDGVVLVDFTLAGSVYCNAQDTEVKARSVIEDDPEKPVYVIGEVEEVLHGTAPPVAGSKIEKSDDFDHLFDDFSMDSRTSSVQTALDLGISSIPDAETILSNEEFMVDDNVALLDAIPNKVSRTTGDGQLSTKVSLPSGVVDTETFDQQVNSNRLVKMNQPPINAEPIIQHYCYKGKMRMHFDTDSRVFLNEFFLFAD